MLCIVDFACRREKTSGPIPGGSTRERAVTSLRHALGRPSVHLISRRPPHRAPTSLHLSYGWSGRTVCSNKPRVNPKTIDPAAGSRSACPHHREKDSSMWVRWRAVYVELVCLFLCAPSSVSNDNLPEPSQQCSGQKYWLYTNPGTG